jgi:putative integral membrane protein (TIGR02587 family)
MEMWQTGFIAGPGRLLAGLFATFVLLIGYNHFAGIRRDITWGDVVGDSVDELAAGVVLATALLWCLGRIGADTSFDEAAGQVAVEAMAMAIGIAVGRAQLSAPGQSSKHAGQQGDGDRADRHGHEHPPRTLAGQAVLGMCGAVLIGLNVAPTEEVLMIATETGPWRIFALALLSMTLVATTLYLSDFRGAEQVTRREPGPIDIIGGTAVTYVVALLAAAGMLWFFGRFDGGGFYVGVAQMVVLGVAASLGASAGRILLQI